MPKCLTCNKRKQARQFSESQQNVWRACKRCRKEDSKQRQLNRIAKGLCYVCGVNPFAVNQVRCDVCRNRTDAEQHSSLRILKDEVYTAYGGYHCACCGETHKEFLTVDHINGDGKEHRKLAGGNTKGIYRWLKKHNFPPGFRILCMNCNFALGHSGYCPHQRKQDGHQD